MRELPRFRAPLWFQALAATCLAACVASVTPAPVLPAGAGGHDPLPFMAFWGVFLLIVDAIWKGIEVAGKVALAILQYSVHLLWRAAVLIAKFGGEVARWTYRGLKVAWHLFKLTYEKVIKPAWKFVWKWVDKTERWLQRTFDPLMRWLKRVRLWVLEFYNFYVRPILDVIGIGRHVLRVLSALGVQWAKRLDLELARIEAAIERPFRLLIAKINEVVNLVNRVVTANGLFQRAALIRSVERDLEPLNRAFVAWRQHPITLDDFERIKKQQKRTTGEETRREVTEIVTGNGGKYAGLISEMQIQWERYFGLR